ncbi:MAG: 4-(cytidine 5'-diphospho)-2-C-methyl-D-erythritol kinase [Fimbriimonadaceae bacterium]
MVLRCPAKVNLFLSVGPPDRRNYHPIRTVFQAVGLFDELELVPADRYSLNVEGMALPESNTVAKTLRLVREIVDVPPLAIRLVKRIPAESGLGGGSSDAAGLLRGLRRLVPTPLTPDQERDVAVAVGADVPFFLVGGRAMGEGYGERLTPLPDRPGVWLTVVRPDFGRSTAEAYRALDACERPWLPFPEGVSPDAAAEGPFVGSAAEGWVNDFERVIGCGSIELIGRLESLGAIRAMLSGSGSAVFGVFADRAAAERAADRVVGEASGVRAWVVTSLSRSESLA